jgi:hypothetical protein
MSDYEFDRDVTMETLSVLTTHEPTPRRAARVRARCHQALGKRTRRSPASMPPLRPGWRRALEPALVGGLSVVYLFEVLSRALRLYRF